MKHDIWIHPVTLCFSWNHPAFHLNHQTTQELIVLKLSFFLNDKENWIIPTIHQQMFSLNTMSMKYSYYKRSLMHQMTISTIMTFIPVRIDILIHATNLTNISALPPFMAQHTCEDHDLTDDPITVPTASQTSCDHTLKPKCAHNPIDIPVKWFKFIHPIPKPWMTKTQFQIVVHKAYSPIAFMNYKWTINLHDAHPLFQNMKQEGYITPSLNIPIHDLSSLAPTKGEMKSSFSWTSLFKSHTSSTLWLGEPTHGKLNQFKLLCSISAST